MAVGAVWVSAACSLLTQELFQDNGRSNDEPVGHRAIAYVVTLVCSALGSVLRTIYKPQTSESEKSPERNKTVSYLLLKSSRSQTRGSRY